MKKVKNVGTLIGAIGFLLFVTIIIYFVIVGIKATEIHNKYIIMVGLPLAILITLIGIFEMARKA